MVSLKYYIMYIILLLNVKHFITEVNSTSDAKDQSDESASSKKKSQMMNSRTMFQKTENSNSWITLDSWTPNDKTQAPIFSENNDLSRVDVSFVERLNLFENRLGPEVEHPEIDPETDEGHYVEGTRGVIKYDDLLTDENFSRRSTRRSGPNQIRSNNSSDHGKYITVTSS